jgi:hypothetical protein
MRIYPDIKNSVAGEKKVSSKKQSRLTQLIALIVTFISVFFIFFKILFF